MKEETLDPENWEELRQLGHQMVDDMLDWQQTLRERPVWQPVTDEVKAQFQQSLPLEAQDLREVYRDFLTNVLPFPNGNQHPRFWGWVQGGGTPFGMLADMLASGMNSNVSIGDHSAMYVEQQVLDWSKEMFGFPATASGILTSGAYKVSENWVVNGGVRYDIQNGKLSQTRLGLGYIDDCFIMSFQYYADYTFSGNVTPSQTYLLQVSLRTLGGTGFQ